MARLPEKRVLYEDKKNASIDWEAGIEYAQTGQKLREEMRVDQRHATVKIETGEPSLFCFLSDLHLFSLSCDYDSFKRHLELIRKHHVYVITVGDLADYFNASLGKTSQGMYDQVFSPEEQSLSIAKFLEELEKAGLLVAVAIGNHEDFLRAGGITFEGTYLRGLKAPVMAPGGFLTVKLGNETYRIVLSHKYGGGSRLRPTAPSLNLLKNVWPEADIAVTGHTHRSGIEMLKIADQPKVLIAGGTYNFSDYGMRMGYGDPDLGGITVALLPDRKRIIPFNTVEEAVETFY